MYSESKIFFSQVQQQINKYYNELLDTQLGSVQHEPEQCNIYLVSTTSTIRIANLLHSRLQNCQLIDLDDLQFQNQLPHEVLSNQVLIIQSLSSESVQQFLQILYHYRHPIFYIVSAAVPIHIYQLMCQVLAEFHGSIQLLEKFHFQQFTVVINNMQEKDIVVENCIKYNLPVTFNLQQILAFMRSEKSSDWRKQLIDSDIYKFDSRQQNQQSDFSSSSCQTVKSENDNSQNKQEENSQLYVQYINLTNKCFIQPIIKNLNMEISFVDLYSVFFLFNDIQKSEICQKIMNNNNLQLYQEIYEQLQYFRNYDQNKLKVFQQWFTQEDLKTQQNSQIYIKGKNEMLSKKLIQLIQQLLDESEKIQITNHSNNYLKSYLFGSDYGIYEQCFNQLVNVGISSYYSVFYTAYLQFQQNAVPISSLFQEFCKIVLQNTEIDYAQLITVFKSLLNEYVGNKFFSLSKREGIDFIASE